MASRFPGSVSGRTCFTTALLDEQEEVIKEAARIVGVTESVGMSLRRFAVERAQQIVDMKKARDAVEERQMEENKEHLRASVEDPPCVTCGVVYSKHSVYELGVENSHVHLRASVGRNGDSE